MFGWATLGEIPILATIPSKFFMHFLEILESTRESCRNDLTSYFLYTSMYLRAPETEETLVIMANNSRVAPAYDVYFSRQMTVINKIVKLKLETSLNCAEFQILESLFQRRT